MFWWDMVKINGNLLDIAGETLLKYLGEKGYNAIRVAVEINGAIIPKTEYANTVLKDGDSVEVVSFVGGG